MSARQEQELNLIGVVSAVCLLKCKNRLEGLKSGGVLEVLMQDPEAVQSLLTIVNRSRDQVIKQQREGDHYRIRIRRG